MNVKNFFKNIISRDDGIVTDILSKLYTIFGRNNFDVDRGNKLEISGSFIRNSRIIVHGIGNKIVFYPRGKNHLINADIEINGNDNFVVLGVNNTLIDTEIVVDDNKGAVILGNNNKICGHTHIAAIEGTQISFGDDCLFSTNVIFRTGDSHSIISTETKKRINPSISIIVGNRVWFGNNTTILKGVQLFDDTIIGTGSIVVKSPGISNVIIAGTPAKVVKRNVRWITERIPVVL